MKVKNFLSMYEGGVCVSIHQEPYDYENNRYTETYFEEEREEEILESDDFKKIANKQVDRFNIIGGGIYKIELYIYLKSE